MTNIFIGAYTSPAQFDHDVLRLFQNNIRFFGYDSIQGTASVKLREFYIKIKMELHPQLEDIIGPQESACFLTKIDAK